MAVPDLPAEGPQASPDTATTSSTQKASQRPTEAGGVTGVQTRSSSPATGLSDGPNSATSTGKAAPRNHAHLNQAVLHQEGGLRHV